MSEEHEIHNVEELKHELEGHDEWFRHAPGEAHQESHGEFNPYVVLAFLAITVVIVFATALVVVPWFARMIADRSADVRERSGLVVEEWVASRTQWEGELRGGAQWINEDENIVRVPIDVAIDEVVRRYSE